MQVAAYSDGHVKVYELLDPLILKNWQLQVTVIIFLLILLLFCICSDAGDTEV